MTPLTLSLPEAADLLGYPHKHVRKMAKRGQLPGAFRFDNQWRVIRHRLVEWKELQAAKRASPGPFLVEHRPTDVWGDYTVEWMVPPPTGNYRIVIADWTARREVKRVWKWEAAGS